MRSTRGIAVIRARWCSDPPALLPITGEKSEYAASASVPVPIGESIRPISDCRGAS